jgi:hypothetical protein
MNENTGLHNEHWRVLDSQPEPKDQRLILLIDRDSLTVIKETGYKIFTGLPQGTVKVLCDSEAIPYLRLRHLGHYFMEPGEYQEPL